MDDGEGEGVSHTRITGDSVSLSSSGSCLGSIMSRCPGRRLIILSNLVLPSLPSVIFIQFIFTGNIVDQTNLGDKILDRPLLSFPLCG